MSMKEEIEPKLISSIPELDKQFIQRVTAFTMSGTEIVDLRNFDNKKAKVACGLRTDYLTSFLC
jgi:hypothetical protein